MKAGWETKPIGELFKVVNGGTPKTGVPAYWDGKHQWITPAEMGGLPSPYVSSTRRSLTDEGLRVGAALIPTDSIILSTRAPIGHLVINQTPMAFNQGCKGLVPSSAISTKFAYYFLLANISLLESLGTGTTFKELSGGKLKEVAFTHPTLPEQRRIVALLDAAFAAIATARAHTEQNLRNARELFESQLAAVFSQRGAGWVTKPLGELCEFQRGLTYSKSNEVDFSDNIVLRANNIDLATNTLNFSELKYIEDSVIVPVAKKVCKNSTIICTASGSKSHLGKAAYIDDDYGYAFGGFMGQLTPSSSIHGRYLFHALTTPDYKNFIQNLSDGANINNLKFDDLKQFTIPAPPLPEQHRIVEKLDAAKAQSQTLQSLAQRKLAALDELKQSLLQQAFSGQL